MLNEGKRERERERGGGRVRSQCRIYMFIDR